MIAGRYCWDQQSETRRICTCFLLADISSPIHIWLWFYVVCSLERWKFLLPQPMSCIAVLRQQTAPMAEDIRWTQGRVRHGEPCQGLENEHGNRHLVVPALSFCKGPEIPATNHRQCNCMFGPHACFKLCLVHVLFHHQAYTQVLEFPARVGAIPRHSPPSAQKDLCCCGHLVVGGVNSSTTSSTCFPTSPNIFFANCHTLNPVIIHSSLKLCGLPCAHLLHHLRPKPQVQP